MSSNPSSSASSKADAAAAYRYEHFSRDVLAIAYNNLAAVLLSEGNWKQASDYLERDTRIVEPIGAIHLAAHAYDDMGEAYRQAGQWQQAWHYLERSLEIKRRLDDLSGLAATQPAHGAAVHRHG